MEDKNEVQKRSKDAHLTGTKERKELVPLLVGSYFTHNPCNVGLLHVNREI